MKRLSLALLSIALVLSLAGCASGAKPAAAQKPAAALTADYYEYVNGNFLAQKQIPSDSPSWDYFYEMGEKNYNSLNQILKDTVAKESSYKKGSVERNIADLYLTAMDNEARNKAGLGMLKAYYDAIGEAKDIPSFIQTVAKVQNEIGDSSLFGAGVEPDARDSMKQIVAIYGPDLGMGKESLEDASKTKQHEAYKVKIAKMLVCAGVPEAEAKQNAEDIFNLQKTLAASDYTLNDKYDLSKTYNVYTLDKLKALMSNMDIEGYLNAAGIGGQPYYVVNVPGLMAKVNSLLTPENLPLLKKYVQFVLIKDNSAYLSMEMRNARLEYSRTVSGAASQKGDEKLASEMAQNQLGFEFGRIYVSKFFPESSKKDVEKMIRAIIGQYEKRIDGLDWMSVTTKTAAKKKLSTLDLKIGYPDVWPKDHDGLVLKGPKDNAVLIDNVIAIGLAARSASLKKLGKPTDRTEWGMTPQTINAYYNPAANEIVFPAAILQAPFYDPKRPYEENLGGIGAVIGHEISHGFDSSGSQYDENGNYKVWWTDEDYAKFQELTKKVADYYSTVEVIDGLHINGQQTLTENIADLGGVAVTTSLVGNDPAKLRKYFQVYATIWAAKMTPDYIKMLLSMDTHSYDKVRVNEVLKNTAAFYLAYPEVKPGDAMYLAPEKRVSVW